MTLSIITPVFNTERYLPACIESVLSQSFKDFEFLLVDDGSSDDSGAICDGYAAKDSRVRVFHKENGGVSSARNLALDHARGEWLYFVDSDDELLPGGLQVLVDCISDDVDIVLGGYERYDETGRLEYSIEDRVQTLMSKEESLETLYEGHAKYYDYLPYCWIRLLRSRIVRENHLRFDPGLRNKEDTLFLMQYICCSNGITRFTTTPVYKYNQRSDSAMGRARSSFDYAYVDSLYGMIRMKEELDRAGFSSGELGFVGKEGIWKRYCKIIARMNRFNVEDVELRSRLKADAFKELDWMFFVRKKLRNTRRKWLERSKHSLLAVLLIFLGGAVSCAKDEDFVEIIEAPEYVPDTTTVVYYRPADDPRRPEPTPVDLDGNLTIIPFTELSVNHQSAAVYGDYLFLVMTKRQSIHLFDLARKRRVYALRSNSVTDSNIYHCNQSTFGTQRYDPSDFFPLLYISQRVRSEKRCFTEVFRIVPLFNSDSTALVSFRTELVQEIFFPPMSRENSMGNVNCVIDARTGKMYTYSRNNTITDDNYMQCKISRFSIPDIHEDKVVLEDSDIESSFMIDIGANNMQGACIVDSRLYIGQGSPSFKYIYLNVVDLREERLVKRYDLLAKGVDWEPEGCYYYDGNVMLSYTKGISRIVEEDE